MPKVDFSLCLITARNVLPAGKSLLDALRAALEGGLRCVQLREKDLAAPDLLALARDVRALTKEFDARLLINSDIDLALECQADGVHLGISSPAVATARRMLGEEAIIGFSAHSFDDLYRAEREGADFVTFSPIYFTPSKAAYGAPQGVDKLREFCRNASIPVFALGGIKLERVAEVLDAGAAGVALISAILAQPDPESSTRDFLQRLHVAGNI